MPSVQHTINQPFNDSTSRADLHRQRRLNRMSAAGLLAVILVLKIAQVSSALPYVALVAVACGVLAWGVSVQYRLFRFRGEQ